MKIRIGIVARLIIFLAVFFSVISLGVAIFVFIHLRATLVEKSLNQAKLLTETYAMAVSDAMEIKDDILLISYMDRLKKIPDCQYAMIINQEGKVLMHTDSTKVRERLSDTTTLRTLEADDTLIQEIYNGEKIYDVSSPVLINFRKVAVLRIGFNIESVSKQMDNYRQQATLILIFMLALSVIGVFVSSLNISKGFSDLNALIESAAKGRISEKIRFGRDDEISDIAAQIQKTMSETRAICDSYENKITSMGKMKNYFITGFAKFFSEGLIVLDDQNKVIYINSHAINLISVSDDVVGKHILEITRSSEIMSMLSDAERQPNTILTETLSSLSARISICTMTDNLERERIGTIIVLS